MSSSDEIIVLDTNVALDLWLFGRASLTALHPWLEQRDCIATPAMREELVCVLERGNAGAGSIAARWMLPHRARDVMDAWGRRVRVVDTPSGASTAPRCRDPSDQKFVDLAVAADARWLLTRDRALLRLNRACRSRGPSIVVPEDVVPR